MELVASNPKPRYLPTPSDIPSARLMAGTIDSLQGYLFPEEAATVARAVPKRQHEFTAGRTLARMAMTAMNLPAVSIPQQQDRSPRWPDTVVAALSHTDTYCICAMALRAECRSVGVDLENIGRVTPELWRQIFTEAEQTWLQRHATREQQYFATAMFSAKEAFFKLQFPLTGKWLGLRAATVVVESAHTFTISAHRPPTAGELTDPLRGSWSEPYPDAVLSTLWLT